MMKWTRHSKVIIISVSCVYVVQVKNSPKDLVFIRSHTLLCEDSDHASKMTSAA